MSALDRLHAWADHAIAKGWRGVAEARRAVCSLLGALPRLSTGEAQNDNASR